MIYVIGTSFLGASPDLASLYYGYGSYEEDKREGLKFRLFQSGAPSHTDLDWIKRIPMTHFFEDQG